MFKKQRIALDVFVNIVRCCSVGLVAVAAVLFLAASPSFAGTCNFKALDFGVSQEELKSKFNLDTLDVAETGEASIISGAAELCKDLPESAVIEFNLIDNKFVQVLIKSQNTASSLLDYATATFGDMDNKDTDPKKIKPGEKVKLGLWAKDEDYSVVYTSYMAANHPLEKIAITSKKYAELFEDANKVKSQAIDNYLKENKLGAYSADPTNKSGKARVKDGDDKKSDLHKDKKLKENENDRGYHYESK